MQENLVNQSIRNKTQNLELLLHRCRWFRKIPHDGSLKAYELYKPWDTNSIRFGVVKAKVSSPYLFKSYNNLNCIKDLSVMLIFTTPAGGHKCIKEHLECPNKCGHRRLPAIVLNSYFYLCLHSKQHLQNCLIDSKDFLTQTAQGRRHIK